MKNATKIWLVAAATLLLVGMITFGVVMTMLKWDFTKLSTVKYETNEHGVHELYQSISIATNTAAVALVPSDGTDTVVVCHEQQNLIHSVRVEDNTLVIEVQDTRKWYEHIGISFTSPKITVYLPSGDYSTLKVKSDTGNVEIPSDFNFERVEIEEHTGNVELRASVSGDVTVKTSTGNIRVDGISARSLTLSVSTGRVEVLDVTTEGDLSVSVSTGRTKLSAVRCKNLTSSGSTGSITLTNVIATEAFSITRSTGNVTFDGCDAAQITVKTDTGNVRGSLLSEKIFDVRTDTGKREYPSTGSGGMCKITTDTGDVKITVG